MLAHIIDLMMGVKTMYLGYPNSLTDLEKC